MKEVNMSKSFNGLKESIRMCNLSYRELANATGVPKMFIQEYMRGAIDSGDSSSYQNKDKIEEHLSSLYSYFESFVKSQDKLKTKQTKMVNERDLIVKKGLYCSNSTLGGVSYEPQVKPHTRAVNVLIYDVEISPLLGWTYNRFKSNLLRVEQEQILLSFSALEFTVDEDHSMLDGDTSKVICWTLADFDFSEERLVNKLFDYFNTADIIMGFNSKGFDTKYANRYFIKYNTGRPSPFKQIDVFKEWKKLARLSSNGLDAVNLYLEEKGKTEVKVGDLWHDCIVDRNIKAYDLLKEYNNQDVVLTYVLFKSILAYIDSSDVNLATLMQHPLACPRCGYIGSFEEYGFAYSQVGRYNQYQCCNCGSIVQGRYQDSTILQDDVYIDVRPILK